MFSSPDEPGVRRGDEPPAGEDERSLGEDERSPGEDERSPGEDEHSVAEVGRSAAAEDGDERPPVAEDGDQRPPVAENWDERPPVAENGDHRSPESDEEDELGEHRASERPINRGAESARSLRRGLISLAVLAVMVVGLVLAVPGLHGVADALGDMNAGWLVAGVFLEVLSCVGYVIAFLQVFERVPVRFGARVALTELAFGAAVSLGGAGSLAVGSWLLVERGGNPTRVVERSAVLFLLTSAVNVVTLILAGLGLFSGLFPGPRNPLLSLVPAAVGVVVLVFFLVLPRFSERLAAGRSPGRLRTLLLEMAITIRLTEQVLFRRDWRIIGAIAYLWCDIAVLVVCFAAVGNVPPIAPLVLAYQIGYLSNIVPVPGSIGVLDGSIVGLLVLYGFSATRGTAATVVYHAISLWVPAMWGTVAFLLLQRSRKTPLSPRPARAGH